MESWAPPTVPNRAKCSNGRIGLAKWKKACAEPLAVAGWSLYAKALVFEAAYRDRAQSHDGNDQRNPEYPSVAIRPGAIVGTPCEGCVVLLWSKLRAHRAPIALK